MRYIFYIYFVYCRSFMSLQKHCFHEIPATEFLLQRLVWKIKQDSTLHRSARQAQHTKNNWEGQKIEKPFLKSSCPRLSVLTRKCGPSPDIYRRTWARGRCRRRGRGPWTSGPSSWPARSWSPSDPGAWRPWTRPWTSASESEKDEDVFVWWRDVRTTRDFLIHEFST